MTENEAIKDIQFLARRYDDLQEVNMSVSQESLDMAIQALEKVQAFEAIGTVEELKTMKENGAFSGVELAQILAMQMELKKYQYIGTVEEFKALKEKSVAKKPTIERVNYSHNQYADNYKCPVCGQRMISKDETGWYSGRRSKYCDNCGQKLDWQ